MLLRTDFYPCDFNTDIISCLITVTRQATRPIITLLKYTLRCCGNTKFTHQIRMNSLQLHTQRKEEENTHYVLIQLSVRISGVPRGGFGVFKPPTKFRRYRRSPRSHEQEEPASRFSFAVHCVPIRL